VQVLRLQRLSLAAGVAALVVAGATTPSFAQTNRMRVGDRQYEMIRDLADYVESGSQYTLEQAERNVQSGGVDTRERQLVTALQDFNRRAEGFLDKVDDYEARPFTVQNDVNSLRSVSRQVNTRLRRVGAANSLRDDWVAVMDGIERMRRTLSGQTVSLPAQRSDWAWYGADDNDRNNGRNNNDRWRNRPSGRVTVLRGQDLTDFRALTQDFMTRLGRVETTLQQDNSWRNRRDRDQALEEVRRLRASATQLHGRTYASELAARTVSDEITELRRGALSIDTVLRQFSNSTAEWSAATSALDRMANMVGASGSGTMGGGVSPNPGSDVFGSGSGTGSAVAISMRDLAEFRRLARELDDQVARVMQIADRDYPGRRERMFAELEQLGVRADTLRRQTETGTFDVGAIDAVVDQLQTDARDVDSRLRSGRVYETTWNEWSRVLQIVETMDRLIHR
jgi:hypothetical protein